MTPRAKTSSATDAEAVFSLRALVAANPAAREWMLAEITRRYPNLARTGGNAPA